MLTVKDVKRGMKIGDPIYLNDPYIVVAKEGNVLHSGSRQSIADLSSYYDDCEVKVRTYDLYLRDNSKLTEATPALLKALRDLVAAEACGYEVETMRFEGLFDNARAALEKFDHQ